MTHEEPAMPPFGDPDRPAPEPNSLDDFMLRLITLATEGGQYGLSFVIVGLVDDPLTRSEGMSTAHICAGPVKATGMLAVALRRFEKAGAAE